MRFSLKGLGLASLLLTVVNGSECDFSASPATGNTIWDNTAGWFPANVPKLGDIVTLSGDVIVTVDTSVQASELTITGTSKLVVAAGGTLSLQAGACVPVTKAPTTKAPTTKAPTTKAPTTKAPTTKAPTTKAPTTSAPSTAPTSGPTAVGMCVFDIGEPDEPKFTDNTITARCLPPSAVRGPGEEEGGEVVKIISPIVDITVVNGQGEIIDITDLPPGEEVQFTIPFEDPKAAAITEEGKLSCVRDEMKCEWRDEDTGKWSSDGCTITDKDVDLGGDAKGARCKCTHLTEFALVIRATEHDELACRPLQQQMELWLIVAYGVVLLAASIQLMRMSMAAGKLRRAGVKKTPIWLDASLFGQHSIAVVVCLLRLAPNIASDPGFVSPEMRVALAGFAYMFEYMLWTTLVFSWTKISLFAMNKAAFGRFSRFGIVLQAVLGFLTIGLALGVALSKDAATKVVVARVGANTMAGISLSMAIVVCVIGVLTVRQIGTVVNATKGNSNTKLVAKKFGRFTITVKQNINPAAKKAMWRVGATVLVLTMCFLIQSVLWVLAVNDVGLEGDNELAKMLSDLFYLADVITLSAIVFLYWRGVKNKCGPKASRNSSSAADSSRPSVAEKQGPSGNLCAAFFCPWASTAAMEAEGRNRARRGDVQDPSWMGGATAKGDLDEIVEEGGRNVQMDEMPRKKSERKAQLEAKGGKGKKTGGAFANVNFDKLVFDGPERVEEHEAVPVAAAQDTYSFKSVPKKTKELV